MKIASDSQSREINLVGKKIDFSFQWISVQVLEKITQTGIVQPVIYLSGVDDTVEIHFNEDQWSKFTKGLSNISRERLFKAPPIRRSRGDLDNDNGKSRRTESHESNSFFGDSTNSDSNLH